MHESIIYILTFLFCGFLFIGIGMFSIKKKTPMHFWAGTVVKSEEISNVKSYNKANGIMWITYGSIYVLSSFACLVWDLKIIAIISVIVTMLGLFVMMSVYRKIYDIYRVR